MSSLLRLANLEQIERQLLALSPLMALLEVGAPDFAEQAHQWLSQTEKCLLDNRLPAAGSLAALRGSLIALQRGGGVPSEQGNRGRLQTRKQRDARIAGLLKEAADLLAGQVRGRRSQVDEAERLMLQLVAVADRVGLLQPAQAGQSHTAYLQALMATLSQRPELGSHIVHVQGMLGLADSLLMLDRVIERLRS
ncbi:hypothetical protein RQP53_15985 [Paucibacter sp. APW11]|uniref:Uncharacterized protein n=1 Tax=Roseateles aquae TaxID=3077235 RepID=A0ABU3PER2_9BURK|nr:hypothetical protein [Paucibacter sp. APW11]MDT9000777.1 hypothetical protein [Paucibacter sp. APW11]